MNDGESFTPDEAIASQLPKIPGAELDKPPAPPKPTPKPNPPTRPTIEKIIRTIKQK